MKLDETALLAHPILWIFVHQNSPDDDGENESSMTYAHLVLQMPSSYH